MESLETSRIYHEEGMWAPLLITFRIYNALQLSHIAIERSTEKRSVFAARIRTYEVGQLVFIDESAVDRRTTYRGRVWAIHGMKATCKAFLVRGCQLVDTLDI
jgi:hypothetical protein